MALVYKRSDAKKARAYERSPGMEPNPGVSHLSVVNPSKRRQRRVSENPFQWIKGRGQRHQHVSSEYDSLRQALGWKKRHPQSDARLYPVDERGTIVSRPISKKLLSNSTRRTGMAYNIGALRRAMRSNPRGRGASHVSEMETARGVKVSSPGRSRKNPKRRRKSRSGSRRRPTANRRRATRRRVTRNSRRGSRRTSRRRRPRRNSAAYRAGWDTTFGKKKRAKRSSKRTSKKRASKRGGKRRMSQAQRSAAAKKGWAKRRRSRRTSAVPFGVAGGHRGGSPIVRAYRTSKAGRSAAAKKGWRKRRRVGTAPKRRTTKRGAARRTSRRRKTRRGTSRRASPYYFGRRRVRATGKEYIDKYLSRGYMPAVARVRRSSQHRSGRPSILSYPIGAGRGRLSKRRTSRRGSRRSYAIGASHRGGRARRMAANKRRRSRRGSQRRRTRRNSRRRTSRPGLYRNKRRSRRSSGRRRSRRLSRNMLAASKVKYGGRGTHRMGRAQGRLYQVVEYGPRSKGRPSKSGKRRRLTGYPVLVPAGVSERAYVRKYRFGGAAKDAHTRARTSGYSERKKYVRRRGVSKNRRTSMRRNSRRRSTRRNPRYVVANRRGRRRRLRRNQFFGADLMKDVLTPVIGGTAGFVAARFLANGLANVEAIRNLLDKDKPAADAENTKIAANVLSIIATLGLATKVPMIKQNQGALVTGMGLALVDRLLGRVTGDAAQYLSGFGEYVSQPLGEYVSQPLGAYVKTPGFGEYVSQPLSGMGTLYAAAGLGTMYATAGYAEGVDPANQAGIDGLMDVMEAAAGTGQVMEAAAGMRGMGTLYAAAGLGRRGLADYSDQGEEDSTLKNWYASQQPQFVSTETPTDVAFPVTKDMPYDRQVPSSLVTPEGKGYAGGMFARHLFAGMF